MILLAIIQLPSYTTVFISCLLYLIAQCTGTWRDISQLILLVYVYLPCVCCNRPQIYPWSEPPAIYMENHTNLSLPRRLQGPSIISLCDLEAYPGLAAYTLYSTPLWWFDMAWGMVSWVIYHTIWQVVIYRDNCFSGNKFVLQTNALSWIQMFRLNF